MKLKKTILTLAIVGLLVGCTSSNTHIVSINEENPLKTSVEISMANGDEEGRYFEPYRDYAVSVAANIFKDKKTNLFSPMSLYFPLALTYDAAEGETKELIGEFLGAKDQTLTFYTQLYNNSIYKDDDGYSLSNNLIYINEKEGKLNENFIERANSYYNGCIYEAEATQATAEAIQGYIKDKTDGAFSPKIELNNDVLAVIINTANYKAQWSEQKNFVFNPKGLEFKYADKKEYIDSVYTELDVVNYTQNKDFEKVELPLRDGFTMIMSKPMAKDFDFTNPDNLKKAFENPDKLGGVELSFPKIDETVNIDMVKVIESMGYGEILNSPNGYPGFLDNNFVTIGEITQEAKFSADENGVEAKAVTVEVMNKAIPEESPKVTINMDQAFVYALKNPAGDLLYIGIFR